MKKFSLRRYLCGELHYIVDEYKLNYEVYTRHSSIVTVITGKKIIKIDTYKSSKTLVDNFLYLFTESVKNKIDPFKEFKAGIYPINKVNEVLKRHTVIPLSKHTFMYCMSKI